MVVHERDRLRGDGCVGGEQGDFGQSNDCGADSDEHLYAGVHGRGWHHQPLGDGERDARGSPAPGCPDGELEREPDFGDERRHLTADVVVLERHRLRGIGCLDGEQGDLGQSDDGSADPDEHIYAGVHGCGWHHEPLGDGERDAPRCPAPGCPDGEPEC